MKANKTIACIEKVVSEKKYNYHILICAVKNKQLEIIDDKNVADIDGMDSLKKSYVPLLLNINDDQVISKTIKGDIETQKAVITAFPNLNLDEFYYESYSNGEKTFISICRKTHVDSFIKKAKDHGFNVVDITFSSLSVSNLINLIDNEIIYSSCDKITFKQGKIFEIEKLNTIVDEICSINGLSIKSNSINSFGSIVGYLTKKNITSNNFRELVSQLQHNFKQRRIFNLVLTFGLGSILVLLLFNFFMFSHYSKKNNALNSKLMIDKDFTGTISVLSAKVNKKKKIAAEIFSTENSEISLLIDRIAMTLPESILLDELSFQPLKKSIKDDKEIETREQLIAIKGITKNNEDFTNWISKLEHDIAVNHVIVLDFGTAKNTDLTFEINLTLIS